jgi:translocator protein
MRSRPMDLVTLAASLLIAFLPGVVGTPFVDRRWYRELDRPSWSPPPAVFGPVWTALYASLGTAAWLAWRRQPRPTGALALYLAQLLLNGLWTPVFFGARRPGAALVVMAALWATSLATIVALIRARLVAGLLLVPYQLWLSFAAALNVAIWRRSRGRPAS